jgi:hypothetical protein
MGEWIGMFLFSWLLLSCLNGNPRNCFVLPSEEHLKPIFRYARFVFFVQLLFFLGARGGSVDLPYLIWLWPIGLVLAIILGLPFYMIQQRKVQLERPPNKKEFEIIREHVQAQFERVD